MKVSYKYIREKGRQSLSQLSAGDCARVINRLHYLAFFLMKDEVLKRALESSELEEVFRGPIRAFLEKRELPISDGAAYPIFYTVEYREESPLRSAWLLPLKWVEGEGPSRKLPPSLLKLEKNIKDTVAAILDREKKFLQKLTDQHREEDWRVGNPRNYHLTLSPDNYLDDLDISDWELEPDSAWVTLLSALYLRCHNYPLREELSVMGTGAWIPDGQKPLEKGRITSVGEIEKKLECAVQFGAKEFYLPEANEGEFEKIPPELRGKVKPLFIPTNKTQPENILARIWQKLGKPPGRRAPLSDRLRYANTILLNEYEKRENYLFEVSLTSDLAQKMRESRSRNDLFQKKIDKLILLVSRYTPAALSILSLLPREAVIFHTDDFKEPQRKKLEKFIESSPDGENISLKFLEVGVLDFKTLTEKLQSEVRGLNGETVALDVTGCTKGMTASAALALKDSPNTLIFHIYSDNKDKVKVGTEEFRQIYPLPVE